MPPQQRRKEPSSTPLKLRNYTTVVSADTSRDAIVTLLVRAGARRVTIDQDEAGETDALHFMIGKGAGAQEYRLPIRVHRVYKRLQREYAAGVLPSIKSHQVNAAHAAAIAWRTLSLLLEAQLDHIATGAGDLHEVMLPYQLITDASGARVTVYEEAVQSTLLPAPRDGPV